MPFPTTLHMDPIVAESLGWLAAALMLTLFACRDPQAMRPLAVATNLAFIAYALAAGLPPVLLLHLLLLPVNLWRWREQWIRRSPSLPRSRSWT